MIALRRVCALGRKSHMLKHVTIVALLKLQQWRIRFNFILLVQLKVAQRETFH